jgi:hypothetical protein
MAVARYEVRQLVNQYRQIRVRYPVDVRCQSWRCPVSNHPASTGDNNGIVDNTSAPWDLRQVAHSRRT